MKSEKRDLDVRLLNVDLGNFRIGDYESPRDAYYAMIETEGEDLTNLAADIVEHGLSPAELFMVCPDPENAKHYIVCDGNRRFTALKLLDKPILAEGTTLHRRFVSLSKEYLKAPIKRVSTVIFPDKQTAMPWIRRRHQDMKGVGMSQWKGLATGRADAFGGRIRASKAVIDYVKQNGQLAQATERTLAGRTTNLDRILQMPYMKAALGVTIDKSGEVAFENGNIGKGVALLQRMLKAMSASKWDVNDIRTKAQREDFIDEFADHNVLAPADPPAGGAGNKSAARGKAAKKTAKKALLAADRHNMDAARLLRKVIPKLPARSLTYLDPPYYVKGKGLHEDHYQHHDHAVIAALIGEVKRPWIVSYDNTPDIRGFYSSFRKREFGLRYSAQSRYEGAEIMFFSPKLRIPAEIVPSRAQAA